MAEPKERVESAAQTRGLRSIALWQAASFALLLLMVWANEVLDLPACVLLGEGAWKDCFGPVLLSVIIVLIAVITIGQTYVKQKRLLSGFITVCSHCHKVRMKKHAWEAIEQYLSDRCPVEFSHGFCPDCFAKEMEQIDAAAAEDGDTIDPPLA